MKQKSRVISEVFADLDERQSKEPDVHSAHLFGLVYPTGNHEIEALSAGVYERYLFGNALNPLKFPEVAKLEKEVVANVAELLHLKTGDAFKGDGGGGSMTSGGTESILMSMKVNRDRAILRGVKQPKILAPRSAHPAYAKAAHYFGMQFEQVPLTADFQVDLDALEDQADETCAVLVGSAFSYPHGIIDPIPQIAKIASDLGAGCHVDACVGGFVLPFWERLGREIPPWDFRVDGVTEISADVHKYGFIPKGASTILHRDPDWFGHQFFFFDSWPSGLYASPAIAGAKPAAPIAMAWAILEHLGIEGFLGIHRELIKTTDAVRSGIEAIDDLKVLGDPVGPVLSFISNSGNSMAICDRMEERDWHLNRNTEPESMHLMLSPAHGDLVDRFLEDLADCTANPGHSAGKQARYA